MELKKEHVLQLFTDIFSLKKHISMDFCIKELINYFPLYLRCHNLKVFKKIFRILLVKKYVEEQSGTPGTKYKKYQPL